MKQPYNTTIYNTALYLRLSRDDELQGESGSIQTQDVYVEGGFYRLILLHDWRLICGELVWQLWERKKIRITADILARREHENEVYF